MVTKTLAGIASVVALAGSVSGAHVYLDNRYATAAQVEREGRQTRAEILRSDIRDLEDRIFLLEGRAEINPQERALLEKYRRRLEDLRERLRQLER